VVGFPPSALHLNGLRALRESKHRAIGPNGGSITDGKGNVWSISTSGLVVENGVTNKFTANVTELAYKNGVLWQENTSHLWYAEEGNVPGNYHGWSPATSVAPVPVTRQWVGGGNNSAGNANDWNTHSVPQAGDTLNVGVLDNSGTGGPHYTINVAGNQLHGDTLNFLPLDAVDTVNMSGVVTANLSALYGDNITVNLAANSEWIGGFTASPGDTLNVRGSGTWDNTGNTGLKSNTNIGVNVVGTGTINDYQAHSGGVLTFLHGVSVGAGQTVIDSGYELYGSEYGQVAVQSPNLFHALVQLGFGEVDLNGLHGTSYSYKNDLLTIFNGKTAIDTLRLVVNNSSNPGFSAVPAITVSQNAASVAIHDDGFRYTGGGVNLPAHS
jgi:hypothetical protein